MNKPVFWIVLMASLMVACGSSAPKPGRGPQERLHRCPSPRPEVCTMDYNPVCAAIGDEAQTFSNGCSACSDKKVKGFYLGACPEAPAADTEDAPAPDESENEAEDEPGNS